MKYTDFVIQCKASKDKEAFAAKHVKKTYMPYAEKMSLAQTVANKSSWDDDGKYRRNTALQTWLLQLHIIAQYTDITWDESDVLNAYDALMECGAMELLLASVPDTERSQIIAMTDMEAGDIYTNYRDLPSWIDTKIDAINLGLNSIIEGLQQTIEKNPDVVGKILQMPQGNSEE